MPQGLDQRSKMEEVVPKMARWRSSDAGQSRRRFVNVALYVFVLFISNDVFPEIHV